MPCSTCRERRPSLGADGLGTSRLGEMTTEEQAMVFQGDADYHKQPKDEMDDEYIAKILATNIDFTLL